MQLTHYTDYSLRVLIYLSLQDGHQRITIANIAEN
ncbi:MAG: Rrf2 family transcriptional regulator, partial [Gammaproteobacteria bacterium]|nr:Rrf2 family transcriptional regulator [Gammaproteobacteria bacterium]